FTGALRQAFVFMNSLETVLADAGPDQSVEINTPLNLTGVCSVSPDDPADPAVFLVSWSVAPSVGVTLDNPDTLTPTFTAATAGTYTVTLACTTRCNTTVTDDAIITVTGPTPPPAPFNTQGGCITNRLVGAGVDGKWVWGALLLLPLGYLLRRVGKRENTRFVPTILLLVLGLCMASAPAQALTRSFSVNSFAPTMDDSDFFTVYSSPTMLKRNYHVGFYLDFAADVYEFGDNNFNRVSGIVDHLLTGNIVGSYAVLDWLTVGALIPVYFWEGIRSPVLGLNQNNFELGDVQLILKFRLVDREKHGFGVAIVPYAVFPSSTNSGAFLGNGSFNGGAKVVIDGRIKDRVSIALNVGYVTASNITDVGGNVLDDQFLASLGISVDVLKDKLKIIAEGQMATVAKNFFQSRRTTQSEERIGFRYTFAHNHDINAGAGFGLTNGIAAPAWRGFIGYTYTKRPIVDVTEPPPPISEIQVGDELTLADKIYFEFDKAVIREISKPTLDKIAGFLKAHPEVTKIRIDGHTCDLGSHGYNQRLSVRRARAVATYLEGQGISADRIGTVEGFGETRPMVPNVDEAHREQNRRVQIFVEAVAQPQ
ncbi:MAG: OmpA family protein, partial [Bacteroidota bacterium]